MSDQKRTAAFRPMFTPFDEPKHRTIGDVIDDTRIEIEDHVRINGRAVITAEEMTVKAYGPLVAVTLTIYAPDVHITPAKIPTNATITVKGYNKA